MKVKKSVDKHPATLPAIAVCIGVSLCLMLISAMAIATLILKEKVKTDSVDYLCKITLAVVTFLGVKFLKLARPGEYIPMVLIYTGAIITLHIVVGLLWGGSVVKILLNAMFVICGCGSALLISNKKKNNIKIKKRYR